MECRVSVLHAACPGPYEMPDHQTHRERLGCTESFHVARPPLRQETDLLLDMPTRSVSPSRTRKGGHHNARGRGGPCRFAHPRNLPELKVSKVALLPSGYLRDVVLVKEPLVDPDLEH